MATVEKSKIVVESHHLESNSNDDRDPPVCFPNPLILRTLMDYLAIVKADPRISSIRCHFQDVCR